MQDTAYGHANIRVVAGNKFETLSATWGGTLRDALAGRPYFPLTCGGVMSCGACHVFVTHGLADSTAITEREAEMLDTADAPRTADSRLACQLRIDCRWDDALVVVASPREARG